MTPRVQMVAMDAIAALHAARDTNDVVVTTNNGYPLDRNLYQCVKGLAAAERVVHAGGTIVMAAECSDGVPAEGDFGRILAEAAGPAELVSTDAPKSLDRWQVQVLGRVKNSHAVNNMHLAAL